MRVTRSAVLPSAERYFSFVGVRFFCALRRKTEHRGRDVPCCRRQNPVRCRPPRTSCQQRNFHTIQEISILASTMNICTAILPDYSFDMLIEITRAAGYQGMELRVDAQYHKSLDDLQREGQRIKRTLE